MTKKVNAKQKKFYNKQEQPSDFLPKVKNRFISLSQDNSSFENFNDNPQYKIKFGELNIKEILKSYFDKMPLDLKYEDIVENTNYDNKLFIKTFLSFSKRFNYNEAKLISELDILQSIKGIATNCDPNELSYGEFWYTEGKLVSSKFMLPYCDCDVIANYGLIFKRDLSPFNEYNKFISVSNELKSFLVKVKNKLWKQDPDAYNYIKNLIEKPGLVLFDLFGNLLEIPNMDDAKKLIILQQISIAIARVCFSEKEDKWDIENLV